MPLVYCTVCLMFDTLSLFFLQTSKKKIVINPKWINTIKHAQLIGQLCTQIQMNKIFELKPNTFDWSIIHAIVETILILLFYFVLSQMNTTTIKQAQWLYPLCPANKQLPVCLNMLIHLVLWCMTNYQHETKLNKQQCIVNTLYGTVSVVPTARLTLINHWHE